MTGNKRLAQAAKEFNVGMNTIIEHLRKKGFEVEKNPQGKLSDAMYEVLLKDFRAEKNLKERAEQINLRPTHQKSTAETDKKADNETVTNGSEAVVNKNKTTDPTNLNTSTNEQPPTTDTSLPPPATEKIAAAEKNTTDSPPPPVSVAKHTTQDPVAPITQKTEQKTTDIVAKSTPANTTKTTQQKTSNKTTTLPDVVDELEAMPIDFKPYQRSRDRNNSSQKDTANTTDRRNNNQQQVKVDNTPPPKPKIEAETKPSIEDMPLYRRETDPGAYGVTGPVVVGKIDLDSINQKTRPDKSKNKGKPRPNANDANKGTNNTPATGGNADSDEAKRKKRKRIRVRAGVETNLDENAANNNNQNQNNGNNNNANNNNRPQNNNRNNNQNQNNGNNNNTRPAARNAQGKLQVTPPNQGGTPRPANANKPQLKLRKKNDKGAPQSAEVSEKEIQDKIKATIAKLSGGAKPKNTRAKLRKQKREIHAERMEESVEDGRLLQVTEFVTVSELAKLMDVAVTKVISSCFSLGIIVTINQRLDAELIEVMASEFGFEVEFIGATEQEEEVVEIPDDPADLTERPPIVTIMGHVDHGKTSLLDYIRKTKVVEGEAGGITQHIGAYQIATDSGKRVTFLDTPGHEAFTAMRARGAKVTDIVVIVIAADDHVMPTTKEAISHAQAAGVPMIFAINKIDRPESDPDRIRQELAQMDLLVEEWGGKYQSQEISAKRGINIDELIEKILLEAELLELKANPKRNAIGTVVEATLDKGKGYISTILVQTGTLRVGEIVLCGQYWGKVKAMFNEAGKRVKEVGPSGPVQILGLSGAPQAGEKIRVMDDEQEAKQIASKREQILREQQQRTRKHITLEEIGRRLALGNFKELNIIIKGDVDGSVQALSDSLLQLSTEEIQVRIIHRGVGSITETDVMLASASDAIIIGFQVRPMPNARKTAEAENIDIRTYSVIYSAIEEIKDAMVGMLEPKFEEKFACTIEIKEVFKITKVGAVAGCYVTEGKVKADTKIRLLRDGIIVHTGTLSSLKRYKDDAKEVPAGLECGLTIKNYSDMQVGDIIEGYEEISIKRTL